MRKLSRRSVVVVAVCMLFAIVMAVFLSPSISLLGAKAEERGITSELREEDSDVLSTSSEDGVYTIKVTGNKTIVWMTESEKSLIPKDSTFSTITDMEVAFNPNKKSLKEGHKFKCFTLENGNLNKALIDLSQLEENKSYNIYPYFIKETGFVIDCLIEQGGEDWHEPITKDYGAAMTLPTESKTGYSFDGWYVMDHEYNRNNFTGTQFSIGSRFNYNKMPDLSVGKEEDGTHIRLEPRFKPIEMEISYVPYNGETIASTSNVKYDSIIELPIPSERNGYEFEGWYFDTTGSNGTGEQCTDSEGKMVSKWDKTTSTTLYAKWETVSYNITYVLNGGSWYNVSESQRPTSYTIEMATITLPTPIKTGYRFMGWYMNSSSFTGTRVYSIPKGSTGDQMFCAKWGKLGTIIFTANNLKTDKTVINGTIKTQQGIEGEKIILPDVNFEGFIFKSEEAYYNQGAQYTISSKDTLMGKSFELIEKNFSQLYNSTTKYYEIWTANQFNELRNNTTSGRTFSIKVSIDLGKSYTNSWIPLPQFRGTLKGNGNSIRNMFIKTSADTGYFGLFESNSGRIESLTVIGGISINGASGGHIYVGMIAGVNWSSGVIYECQSNIAPPDNFYARTEITENGCIAWNFEIYSERFNSEAGGLIGQNQGSISKCINYSEIFGKGDVAGISGTNHGGSVSYCTNYALMNYWYQEINRCVSGIVGYLRGGTISHCDNYGTIAYVNGTTPNDTEIYPAMAQIIGRKVEGENNNNVCYGSVDKGTLHSFKYGGVIGIGKKTHDQAKYVSVGEIGQNG